MNDEPKPQPISQSSNVTLGLLIVLIGLCSGGIWGAAVASTKLDTVIKNQSSFESQNKENTEKNLAMIKELQEKTRTIELVGSPVVVALREKVIQQEVRISALENKRTQ